MIEKSVSIPCEGRNLSIV